MKPSRTTLAFNSLTFSINARFVHLLVPVVLLAGFLLCTPRCAQSAELTLDALPLNSWVQLPDKFSPGYSYSAMVFAPTRGQLLHWGAVAHGRNVKGGRNDMLAFDAKRLRWVSDYDSDPGQTWGIFGGGSGNAVSFTGLGKMLKTGRPSAGMVVNAAVWDSHREELVISLPGLMAAYDPAKTTWRSIAATSLIHGHKLPGGPPVYGAGMGYDPANDELVLFSHFGAQAADERNITGRISGHLGTLRYSRQNRTWRRVADTFGTPEQQAARESVLALSGDLSKKLDAIWRDRHTMQANELAAHQRTLQTTAKDFGRMKLGGDTGEAVPEIVAHLKAAAVAKSAEEMLQAGVQAQWRIQSLLTNALAVEPPPRAISPLVLDEKHQCLVLFGGDSGRIRTDLRNTIEDRNQRSALYNATDRRLNDTWIYDLRTRQWKNITTDRRPPAQQSPNLVYDPHSGQLLLVVLAGNPYSTREPRKISIWSLEVASGHWQLRGETDWSGPIDRRGWYTIGLDPKHRLLLLAHVNEGEQTTWAMRYDVAEMKATPAPQQPTAPPETPTQIPPDDPQWVAKLKSLPANTWVPAQPPVEPSRRDWGNIACDPVRGWMVYFGGGHSTYQGTDVAVYVVGANRWVHQAGGHNDSLPPVGWGGYHVDMFGGNNAGHMRNQYVAIDGRMLVNVGFGGQIKPRSDGRFFPQSQAISLPKNPHAWFYDIDRGGVWRQRRTVVRGELPAIDRGRYPARPSVVDPAGKVYGVKIVPERRYSNVSVGARVYEYDIYAGTTTIHDVPAPWPKVQPESRPFCMLPNKQQIFFQDYDVVAARKEDASKPVSRTMVYDIQSNKFIDLKPANQPPGVALGAAYIADQNAVLCAIKIGNRQRRQWVYSFTHNRWSQLPLVIEGDADMRFQAPYAQYDYVAKYGVLVNYSGATYVMRPDLTVINR